MLKETLKDKHIILGSQSPRRKSLLSDLDISFETRSKNVDESFPDHLSDTEVPIYLSKKKADAFEAELNENDILITSDTVVSLKGRILNKPQNREQAYQMLRSLSGKKNDVITGVCLKCIKKEMTFSVRTSVYFKELTDDEIYYYIDQYKPFDKAGAYGIQEWIGKIAIYRIEGCYFNVMGLPLQELYKALSSF